MILGMVQNVRIWVFILGLGTKNVAKELKKITTGLVKNRDVTWFPQLIDKRKLMFLDLITITCILIRTQYQDPPILGYEELW